MTLTFAIPRVNTDMIESTFKAVSDPKHESYTGYLTHEQVELLTVNEQSMSHVESVLRHVTNTDSYLCQYNINIQQQTYYSSNNEIYITRIIKRTCTICITYYVSHISCHVGQG